MQYTTEDVAEDGDEMSIAKKIAKQRAKTVEVRRGYSEELRWVL